MAAAAAKTPLSARKRAAILANLAKANAAKRTPESRARSRHNALKHGLFVRAVAPTLERLGEDPEEFRRLGELLRQTFVPRNAAEQILIARLGVALWRRLRLYRAAARWEEDTVRRTLASFAPAAELSAEDVFARGYELVAPLHLQDRFERRERLLTGEVERLLRLLLLRRSRKARDLHIFARRHRADLAELSPHPRKWKRRYAAAVPLRPLARLGEKGEDGEAFGREVESRRLKVERKEDDSVASAPSGVEDRSKGGRESSGTARVASGMPTLPTFETTLAREPARPEELQALQRAIERAFPPRTEAQQEAVRCLARALGERLRLYRAQAHWEADTLATLLGVASEVKHLDADQIRLRATVVVHALSHHESVSQQTLEALRAMERALEGFLPASAQGANGPIIAGRSECS